MAFNARRPRGVDWDSQHGSESQAKAAIGPGEPSITDEQLRWREALILWLRWNEAYERVTERMFEVGEDPRQLESLMDQMDELRRRAISLSHDLLD